jgi:hypothetical protein
MYVGRMTHLADLACWAERVGICSLRVTVAARWEALKPNIKVFLMKNLVLSFPKDRQTK